MDKLPESGVDKKHAELPEKITLGDVIVFMGSFSRYRHNGGLVGGDRSRGLRALPHGGEGFTYYWAPYGGPVIKLKPADWARIIEWDYYFGEKK